MDVASDDRSSRRDRFDERRRVDANAFASLDEWTGTSKRTIFGVRVHVVRRGVHRVRCVAMTKARSAERVLGVRERGRARSFENSERDRHARE